ncbi:hypothetical protein NDU88_006300 [Pleurodeles waltl]|uniref:Uncharacterized protein n=1 Tax=Pleurodeles waltl TaxID=8319 RepID=A0AAV7VPC7_PLEWA|nr:hypothetical protein NDU88_006300 [Pleurodeles waltl]
MEVTESQGTEWLDGDIAIPQSKRVAAQKYTGTMAELDTDENARKKGAGDGMRPSRVDKAKQGEDADSGEHFFSLSDHSDWAEDRNADTLREGSVVNLMGRGLSEKSR